MTRTSLLLFSAFVCLSGCQNSGMSFAFKPSHMFPKWPARNENPEDIEKNSIEFVEQATQLAENKKKEGNEHIRRGQQEIAAWYQDQDNRHINSAKRAFQLSLESNPAENAEAHHGLAVVADLEKNFAEAEKQYHLALVLAPRDPQILSNLGYSYLLQERLAESERYLKQATQIDPTNQDAANHLAEVRQKQGRSNESQLANNETPQSNQAVLNSVGTAPQSPSQSAQDNELFLQRHQQNVAQIQNAQFRPQGSTPTQPYDDPSQYVDPRTLAGQQLKDQLAAIDREQYRSVSGQPMMLDSASGEIQRVNPSRTDPRQLSSNFPQAQQLPGQRDVAPVAQQQINGPSMETHAVVEDANLLPQVRPASATLRDLQASNLQTTGRATLNPPPQSTPWLGGLAGELPGQSSTTNQAVNADVNSTSSQPQSGNAFEQAQLDAAKMGMGLGPGTLFSAVNTPNESQSAPRMQPGTTSNWNGNSFPQAQRVLPTDYSPSNLSQAVTLPPVSSVGQQIPGSQLPAPQQQFGTASRYEEQIQQLANAQLPPSNQMQQQQQIQQAAMENALAQQRQEASQQLNQNMQQAWDQRPLNLHSPQLNRANQASVTDRPQIPSSDANTLPQVTPGSMNQPGPGVPLSAPTQIGPQAVSGATMRQADPLLQPAAVRSQNQNYGDIQPAGGSNRNQYSKEEDEPEPTYYDASSTTNVVVPPPYHYGTVNSQPASGQQSYTSRPQSIQSGYSSPPPYQSNTNSFNSGQVQANGNLPLVVPGAGQ